MSNQEENLQDILTQVQDVDNGINMMLIPLLKDTIKDSNAHNNKLFTIAIIELIVIFSIIIISLIVLYNQNLKYQELLNQVDFQTEYIQDLDSGQGNITDIKIETNRK